jgi:hypothetical protein
MQDLTLYYLFLKCNLMHYYFDKILSFTKSGCYINSTQGGELALRKLGGVLSFSLIFHLSFAAFLPILGFVVPLF